VEITPPANSNHSCYGTINAVFKGSTDRAGRFGYRGGLALKFAQQFADERRPPEVSSEQVIAVGDAGQATIPFLAAYFLSFEHLEALAEVLKGKLSPTEKYFAFCKINSVMIPGINDRHLVEVNRAVKSRGALLHNIMPLISAPEHGTVFGLTGQRGPSAQELKALQDSCEGEMNMMRHCRQCRADAVGLLGEDRSAEFTTDKIMEMEVNYDLDARQAYQTKVEEERQAKVEAKNAELWTLAGEASDISILIAVATKGSGRVNEHFGHAKEFQIYELSTLGAKFVGHRRVDVYCQGGFGDEDSLETVIRAINDCAAVLVAKIGGCPKESLIAASIEPVDQYAFEFIEQSAIAYFVINPKKCTECIGYFDTPQCVAVCPVDNTCVIDASYPRYQAGSAA
jgi:nitrogenase cofactor biosynthesis protein NifB